MAPRTPKMLAEGVKPPDPTQPRPPEAGPVSWWQIVTPTLAALWLLRNTHNRHMRESVSDEYAADMRAGNWTELGDSIQFDWNAVLMNGQHRLAAIVKSGVSLYMLVTCGIDPKALKNGDRGRRRTTAQNLMLLDIPGSKSLVSYTNMCDMLLANRAEGRLTIDDMLRIHKESTVAWEWALPWCGNAKLRQGEVGGAFFFAYFLNPVRVTKFVEEFLAGSNLAPDSPVLAAKKMVYEGRGGVRWGRRESAIRLLRFVRAYLQGEKGTFRHIYVTESTVEYFVPGFLPGSLLHEIAEANKSRRVDPPRQTPTKPE